MDGKKKILGIQRQDTKSNQKNSLLPKAKGTDEILVFEMPKYPSDG